MIYQSINQSINHKGKRSYKQMKSFTLPSRVSDERIFPNISLRCFIVSYFVFLFKVEQAVLVDQEKLWHFSQRTMQQICAGTNRAFISQQRFQIWAVLTLVLIERITGQPCIKPEDRLWVKCRSSHKSSQTHNQMSEGAILTLPWKPLANKTAFVICLV